MLSVGNDFVLLDERIVGRLNYPSLAVRMCDRHRGIGGDGLLVVGASKTADFRFRMFNPDGSEDGCGNGLRCGVAYWLKANRRPSVSHRVRVEQLWGISDCVAHGRKGNAWRITANMGVPSFDPKKIPLACEQELVDTPVIIAGQRLRISCVTTGSAHTVIFSKRSVLDAPIPPVSRAIEVDPLFPERTNIMWAYVRNRSLIEVRIWERGVSAETLGCGTGACAVAVVAARLGLVNRKVTVLSPGGRQMVEWRKSGEVLLTGEAVELYRGVWA